MLCKHEDETIGSTYKKPKWFSRQNELRKHGMSNDIFEAEWYYTVTV